MSSDTIGQYAPEAGESSTPFVLLFLALLAHKFLRIGQRAASLPKGPPTIPLLGNLHVLPTSDLHLRFTEWAHQYGDIYSLKIGPETAIVITSIEAARELMDKRSTSTCDRPKNHMAEKVTMGLNMTFCPYSDRWRALRKAAHMILGTSKAVERYAPILKAEATQVLFDLLNAPDDFFKHIGRYSNSVIMSILFGKRCPRYESAESVAFFKAAEAFNHTLSPSIPPVDLLPFLDYIPERWAWWKGLAKQVRQMQRRLYFGLLDECEARMNMGEETGSCMEDLLRRKEELGLNRELVGHLGGVLLEGASETTSSFLRYLILLLVAFPEVQRKAQEEIDRVIGRNRLPTAEDFKNLPYIQALIKETHRFHPVGPLAVPHATLTDETFRGYVIPKGTTVFVNTYGIFHHPDYFDNPHAFFPERYLVNEYGTKLDVDVGAFRDNLAFGYGRRICPGMHLANSSLMLNAMNFIWAFDFGSRKDNEGNDIPVRLDSYDKKGFFPFTTPFECSIRPRDEGVVDIIRREFKGATETFVKFERDLAEADGQWVQELRGNM
uniref:Putative cytochrome P450 n=1 Tax=Moniliophthora roreri TaxID=221103 RepID=A0A0W0G6J3_MONRR